MTQRMARLEEDVHEIRGALTEQREVIDVMDHDFSRFSTWVTTGIGRMMDRVGVSYTPYSQTHMSYQRRVRQRSHGKTVTKPKRKRDATWFRDKVLMVEAQGNGKVLNEEELELLADLGIAEGPVTQTLITHNAAYQANDLDSYDSDCDDFSTAKAVLIANLSSYGLDVFSEKAQQIRPMLYDGSVTAKETNVISIADSEETLMLEEESRSKMLLKQSDFGKHFILQQKLSDEQAFRLQSLHPNTEQFASSPVKIEAPRELPKVTEVQIVFNQMKVLVQQYNVEKQCFEIQKKHFLIENDRLLDQIISQDIVNIVMNSSLDINTSVNVNSSVAMNDSVNYVEMCNKCLELEAGLIKQRNIVEKDEYNRLLKSFSKLEQRCISLELAMQLNKEILQKNNTSVNQTEPLFDQLFELNNLKTELQAKDTTIKKLKAKIKHLNKTSTTNSVKNDIDEIETINIELEHRVTKLITENEHLKQTYKQLYDLIKRSCVQAKELAKSLSDDGSRSSVDSLYESDCILEFDGAVKGNHGSTCARVVLHDVDGSLVSMQVFAGSKSNDNGKTEQKATIVAGNVSSYV
ncbi:hypothetical protein Tco_1015238 [Tanacetum coccineum]|uniref:Uncharacterized protein n=1 Tax=Tanacetum coccineum TaxID=301880 RepID=A0ABQ5FLB7_9ASTR